MPGSKISNVLESNSFAASFMYLKLRRGCKKDYMEIGESQVGIRLQDS